MVHLFCSLTESWCVDCMERIHNCRWSEVRFPVKAFWFSWLLQYAFLFCFSDSCVIGSFRYYYNKETKQSKWTMPDELKVHGETIALIRYFCFFSICYGANLSVCTISWLVNWLKMLLVKSFRREQAQILVCKSVRLWPQQNNHLLSPRLAPPLLQRFLELLQALFQLHLLFLMLILHLWWFLDHQPFLLSLLWQVQLVSLHLLFQGVQDLLL